MGKAVMFMVTVWLAVSIAGGIYQGSVSIATTVLTEDISSTEESDIPVSSTNGFLTTGVIVIGDERIGYASKTSTSFTNAFAAPIVRGMSGTEAIAHYAGDRVRTIESSMLNSSLDYKLATITDTAGIQAFITIPWQLLNLIGTFFTLPIAFMGTELQLLTYVWAIFSLGLFVAFGIAVAGSRRV